MRIGERPNPCWCLGRHLSDWKSRHRDWTVTLLMLDFIQPRLEAKLSWTVCRRRRLYRPATHGALALQKSDGGTAYAPGIDVPLEATVLPLCTNFPKADCLLPLRVFGCLPNTVGRAPMAGVRKASREETAGKLATALMRAYEDLGTATEGFVMSRMGAKAGWRVDGLLLSIGRRVRRNFCVDRTTFQRPAKAGLVISGRAPP